MLTWQAYYLEAFSSSEPPTGLGRPEGGLGFKWGKGIFGQDPQDEQDGAGSEDETSRW